MEAAGFNMTTARPEATTETTLANDAARTGVAFWLGDLPYSQFDSDSYISTLWNAVISVSDDGQIFDPFKLREGIQEPIGQSPAGTYNTMAQWGYRRNGNNCIISLSIATDVSPNGDDNTLRIILHFAESPSV